MASIFVGAAALVSDKSRKEKELRNAYAREFEEMKRENARLHAERQKLRQTQRVNVGNDSGYPDVQPPSYEGVVRRHS
jgi:hypothetical protein